MNDHTITIEFEAQSRGAFGPTLTFRCHAAPDAPCRTLCPRSECEEGCVNPDEHVREPIDFCNFEEWMDNTDEPETCIAAPTTSVTAPIEIEWGGTWDGPDWRFATPDRFALLAAPLRSYLDDLDGFYGDEAPDDVLDYPSGGKDTAPLRLSDLRALVDVLNPPVSRGTTGGPE